MEKDVNSDKVHKTKHHILNKLTDYAILLTIHDFFVVYSILKMSLHQQGGQNIYV